MPRPEPNFVTLEIDGLEVRAPEGAMLVDGAKYGDVEIPVFCYEPKLGAPVGACRMCLVEIEGIPKLQTACSTPVKDGMTVITGSERVKQAQNAIVEFLLVNHPLDCPVCDKGGECPLQEISYGWGAGRSRFIEPKRHFKKPLELSPMVAIDRERCIICFRCVRFSQEISEDHQLVFVERGDQTFVGTHHGHPYVGPFSGNIIDLCPVGALTSTAYRFRARPWDYVEEGGTICTLCPSQCNVKVTVRDDEKVLRVRARDNHEVDDGWLCDKGRFAYQSFHAPERITSPMVREGGALREVPWDQALAAAAAGLKKGGESAAALVGGEATNEEGFLVQHLMRDVLGSPHVDSRAGGPLDRDQARALSRPDLAATVSDLDFAGVILVLDTELVEESPILDLRVRKAARRNAVKVVVASSRPSTLDAEADALVRFAPGAAEATLGALAAAIRAVPEEDAYEGEPPNVGPVGMVDPVDPYTRGAPVDPGGIRADVPPPGARGEDRERSTDDRGLESLAARAGADASALELAAELLKGVGEVVVLWGERVSHGERGRHGARALIDLATLLSLGATDGAGLIEVPAATNARGLREVGCVPNMGPGLSEPATPGRPAAGIAEGLADGELSALLLFGADPLESHPDRLRWEAALGAATSVVAFADFLHGAAAEHADVIFPAESYAEKEGTVTHPDGRVQRVRQSVGHHGEVRAAWSVLLALEAAILDSEAEYLTAPMVTTEIARAVPFYAGMTLEEIGGQGVRWPLREAASALGEAPLPEGEPESPPERGDGLRLGTRPTLWSGRAVEHTPVLRFLAPKQQAELSAEDAHRLGVRPGDEVEVAVNGTRVRAEARLRDRMPPGSVFLVEGTSEENATALTNGAPRVVEVSKR
jgi:NADH-quinone oxidoreductase subunit G